jgi:Protein of unknown function (DUF3073)
MGRGRAKAKQTKVARDLKYRTHETDFERLQRELQGQSDAAEANNDTGDDADEAYDDPYAHDPYAADPQDDSESAQR